MRAFVIGCLLVLTAARADAATYYVDIACGTSGTGTTDSCGGATGRINSVAGLQTLLGGAGPLVAGDTVIIHAGTYVSTNNGGGKETSGFAIGKSGTAGNPITIMNAPGESPLLSNCALAATTTCARATITAQGREYVVVKSNSSGILTIKGGIWLYGKSETVPDNGSQGMEFSGLEITQGWGQIDDGNWSAFFIDGQDGGWFHHNNIHDLTPPSDAGNQDSGSFFKLYYNSDVIIEYNTGKDNTIPDTQAGGIDDKAWGVRNIHRFNWFENMQTCVRLNTQSPSVTMQNVQVYGNVCIGPSSPVRAAFKWTHDITSASVYNNTAWRFSEAIITETPSPIGVQYYNNIIANVTSANVEAYVSAFTTPTDYNAWVSGEDWVFPSHNSANLAAWQASGLGFDAHSHTTACTFVNATAGVGADFHIASGTCQTGGKTGGTSGGTTIEQGAYGVTTCVGFTCGAAAAAPTVTSVSPASGTTLGGTAITITGSDFVATPTSITVGGVACTGIGFTNSTTLTCTTGAHAAGTVSVVVTNPDAQTGTGTNVYTYAAPSNGPYRLRFR